MKQLNLGKYPYTYARVSVIRSYLLEKGDYHRLLKMSTSEITSFLQSSAYKKAIDELGVKYSGIELMEMALNKSLVNMWNKLRRISAKEVRTLIDNYLERADLWNIKAVLRALHTNAKPEMIAPLLLPAGQLSQEKLEELAKSDSVEEFLKKLAVVGIKFEALRNAIETLNEKNTIIELENIFDREYYNRMEEFSRKIPSEGKLFKQFLEAEVENTNLMNVLRLKRAGMDKGTIHAYIIGKPSRLIKQLIATDSKEETAKLLSQTVSEQALNSFTATNSLAETEIDTGRNLLKRTRLLLHQHPLTVDVILGYMFAKEAEVKNLKMLLKARQLGLSNEFAEQQVII